MARSAMVFPVIRRVGRVFALLLLAWTSVDLIDHDLFGGRGAPGRTASAATLGQAAPHQDGPCAPQADHSFCCSHTVDVQTPYSMAPMFSAAGVSPADSPTLPFCDPGRPYRPPLA